MCPQAPRFGLSVILALVPLATLSAENWTRFRGLNGSGISHEQGIPATWSPGDYAWTVELPGEGHSSPVVYDDRLFVTTAIDEGAIRYLYCLDPASGDVRWQRLVGFDKSHRHRKSSWASSTPVTDGEHVYVAFADQSHYVLAAWTIDGDLVWRQKLGTFESQHGQGVSPIVFDNLVILPNDQMGASSIVAFDRQSGAVVWSTLRSIRKTSYSTPMILEADGQEPQLICLSGAMGVTSLNPRTGGMNWMTGELPMRTVASPIFGDGLVVATCGGGGVGRLLVAVDPSLKMESAADRIRYERKTKLPYVPTPVYLEGHLYLWTDQGIACCVRMSDGETIWTERVSGDVSGSPICIDGRLYCIAENGDVVVIAAAPEYKFFGKTSLSDPSHATPAVANGRLFLRTFHRLICLKAES